MHWFVWFCFLTAPALVGVAFTLSTSQPNEYRSVGVVGAIGLLWLFAAYRLKKYLTASKPNTWVRWWVTLAVFLPLVGFFVRSLGHNPAIVGVFQRHERAMERLGPADIAPAAPSRQALSWVEVRELLARMRPCAGRFSIQILTSLPPAWWLIAFGIAVWRGK